MTHIFLIIIFINNVVQMDHMRMGDFIPPISATHQHFSIISQLRNNQSAVRKYQIGATDIHRPRQRAAFSRG